MDGGGSRDTTNESGGPAGGAPALGFVPLFVGGAPRSGTTMLHGLICASRHCNPYIGEASYFTALLESVARPLELFDLHTSHYFDDPTALLIYHARLLRGVLSDFWRHLGKPRTLALKDPLATRSFPLLAALVPEARFVVIARDPRDVAASRIRVVERAGGAEIGADLLANFCHDYNQAYQALVGDAGPLEGRVLLVNYENLARRGDTAAIAEFTGLDDIAAGKLWSRGDVDFDAVRDNPWISRHYGRPLNAESVGTFRDKLTPEAEKFVLENCGETARALGITLEPR